MMKKHKKDNIMIFNNTFYQLLSEILIMYPKIIIFIIVVFVILFLGIILKIKDTKDVIKCIFHPIFISIFVLCVIWFIAILYLIGSILIKYYSFSNIIETFVLNIMPLCIGSYKIVSDDSFLKNHITNIF